MLPNHHHPGPRCACAARLAAYGRSKSGLSFNSERTEATQVQLDDLRRQLAIARAEAKVERELAAELPHQLGEAQRQIGGLTYELQQLHQQAR